jgi:conjugative relaxase-like TrwC/TraI family protein
VLSIGKLAAGQANYYLHQAAGRVSRAASVGSGVEDYYVGGHEAPGVWTGAAASSVGVSGQVDGEALTRLLAGADPRTGAEIVPDRPGRVPGFDLTFSAPKSVSVLFGLGDEPLRRTIRSEHEAAVADALGYMERAAARGRRGRGGATVIEGSGFIAAAFRHRTSRAGDPQLHTHVLIANLVEAHDGRWSALDGRGIYQHAKTAGYLYEASLRVRLTRRLGVEWTPVRNGIADIEGVPAEVLRAFSRRRSEVEAELRRRGESSAAAARMATLATRRRKDYGVVPEELVAEWRERAVRLGFDREALRSVVEGRQERRAQPVEWHQISERLGGPSGLTHRRSTFARRDVLQELAERIPASAGVSVQGLEEAADAFIGSDWSVPILEPSEATPMIRRRDGRVVWSRLEGRYSTVELLNVERQVISAALDGRGRGVGRAADRSVEHALARRATLTPEQVEMVRRLSLGGDRVAVVVGQAGTGKTFALDAAREAWEASGISVLGAAVARRAARELSDGAGIDSTSIAALKRRLRLGANPLPPGCVLVVDEAAMLPTRALAEILREVERVDGKLVLAGDHRQLPELEAGGCFRGLARRLPAILLQDNRRQYAAWEKRALRELRDGDVTTALAEYQRRGRVIAAKDSSSLQAQLVSDWWESGGPHGGIMIALRRVDVRSLNRLARGAMLEHGQIAGSELTIAGEAFAAGDFVVLRQNDGRLGVANGDRGVVTAVGHDALAVEIGGRHVTLPADYLARTTSHGDPVIAHGYAVTGHVAQGLTTERVFVLTSDLLYREWAYTAMSRGRQDNRLYILRTPDRTRDEIAPAIRRSAEDELLGNLRRSRGQRMATDIGKPQISALQKLRDERQSIEERLAALGEPPRRRWGRAADEGRGERALLENRLNELALEETQLAQRGREAVVPGDVGRGSSRGSLER